MFRRGLSRGAAALALAAAPPAVASGQATEDVTMPLVTAKASEPHLEGKVPFSEAFLMRFAVGDFGEPDKIALRYGRHDRGLACGEMPKPTDMNGVRDTVIYVNDPRDPGPRESVVFEVAALRENTEYAFDFHVVKTGRQTRCARIVTRPVATIANNLDSDFGILGPTRRTGYIGAVTNVHLYARPINAHDGEEDAFVGWDELLKRVSVFVGVAFPELESRVPVDHTTTVGSPVYGIGVRLIPGLSSWQATRTFFKPLRVNAGIITLSQDHPNPLIDRKIRKRDGFLSVTYDVTVRSLLTPIATVLARP